MTRVVHSEQLIIMWPYTTRGRDTMSKVGGLGVHEVHYIHSFWNFTFFIWPIDHQILGGLSPPLSKSGGAQAPPAPPGSLPLTTYVCGEMIKNHVEIMHMNNLSRDAERQGNNNNTTERQSNTTQLARNSHFSKKNWLPRVGLEPTTISSPGDALTNWATEAAQLAGPNPAYKSRSISTWWTGELKHWYLGEGRDNQTSKTPNPKPSIAYEQSFKRCWKARQQQQHNRKAKQHNTTRPKQSFFKEKLAASGGTRTHDHQLSRWCSYQLSYRGSSAGWAESCIQITKHLNLMNRWTQTLVFRRRPR